MLELAGYIVEQMIAETPTSFVYQAVRLEDKRSVILKTSRNPYPGKYEVALLQKEHELLKRVSSPLVVRSLDLIRYKSTFVLVLEDYGGLSLKAALQRPLPMDQFWPIALQCLKALNELHSKRIIHKDINPSNITIDPAQAIKLIDLGISTEISTEKGTSDPEGLLEGSLPYISPEQTGRINRFLDYRSDYYSLGIVFFEVLSGQLPFVANDALGYVHAHIAKQPPSLRELSASVPEGLERIIFKMMAKNPEDRYQSSDGIIHDLEQCRAGHNVVLGEADISEIFSIPQALYGREEIIDRLQGMVERITKGSCELVTLTGVSGIGKTSVVDEIGQAIVISQAFFVKAKFDQLQGNIAFQALKVVFQSLYKQALFFHGKHLDMLNTKLKDAIDGNWQIVSDLAPRIFATLGPGEAGMKDVQVGNELKNRNTLREIMKVFATKEHSLILCLDDVQWADQETLGFLKDLFGHSSSYLLVILSYRDNEVTQGHYLNDYLASYKELVPFTAEAMQAMSLAHLQNMLVDSFRCEIDELGTLPEQLFQKTNGNPFYIKELLRSLYQDGALKLDRAHKRWRCDEKYLRDMHVAANVVDFLINRLLQLPETHKTFLNMAASIGHEFELKTLVNISQLPIKTICVSIWDCMKKDLIIALSDSYRSISVEDQFEDNIDLSTRFKFHHDRIQQAAYDLVPAKERPRTHLDIARSLVETSEDIAEITRHYNLGRSLMTDPDERIRVAEYNKEMAIKARQTNAYQQLLRYSDAGLDLLHDFDWDQCPKLLFELHEENMHASFSLHQIEKGEQIATLLLSKINSSVERAKFYYILGFHYFRLSLLEKNVDAGINGLAQLGIKIKKHVSIPSMLLEMVKAEFFIRTRKIETLLKTTDDERVAMAMKLFNNLQVPVGFTGNANLVFTMVLKAMRLAFQKGSTIDSAPSYVNLSVVRYFVFKDFKSAAKFLEISFKLLDTANDSYARNLFNIGYGSVILPNLYGLDLLPEFIEKAIKDSYKSGDVTSLISMKSFYFQYYALNDLEFGINSAREANHLAKENNCEFLMHTNQISFNHFSFLSDPNFDLEARRKALAHPYSCLMEEIIFHIFELERLFIFRDFSDILPSQMFNEKNIHRLFSCYPYYHLHILFSTLTYCEFVRQKRGSRVMNLLRIRLKIRWMKGIVKRSSSKDLNHMLSIMEAELASLTQDPLVALKFYRAAIEVNAKKYLKYEALTAELATRFCMANGLESEASDLIFRAVRCYGQWGAKRKILLLEEEFASLLQSVRTRVTGMHAVQRDNTVSKGGSGETEAYDQSSALDLPTFIRASQDLAREVKIDRLAAQLIHHVMENAGADRGFLLLRETAEMDFYVATSGESGNLDSQARTVTNSELSKSIIDFVSSSEETLILDDACSDRRFKNDPYLQRKQVKSVLCLPIILQGKTIGIIYLENNLANNAFTNDRVGAISMIAGQAAVAIENSLLYQNLEHKIAERTSQVRLILTSIHQGIFMVNQQSKIDEDYSIFLEQILERKNIAGSSFREFFADRLNLSSEQRSMVVSAMDSILGFPSFSFELNGHILPREAGLTIGDQVKILEIEWTPIVGMDGNIERILVAVKDVTRLRELEYQAARQTEEFAYLKEMTEVLPEKFAAAAVMCRNFIKDNLQRISIGQVEDLRAMFINFHTMKGVFRALGLFLLSSAVHEAEQHLVDASSGRKRFDPELAGKDLRTIEDVLNRYEKIDNSKLRRAAHISGIDMVQYGVEEDQVAALLAAADLPQFSTIKSLLKTLFYHSSHSVFQECSHDLRIIAEAVKKPVPSIDIVGSEVYFTARGKELINKILPHLLGNSMDHGIEDAEERLSRNKPEHGLISFEVRTESQRLEITYFDDGRGLDLGRIRAKALANGLISEEQQLRATEIAELIFLPGFSTSVVTTSISGRGVGMDAVKTFIEEAGGRLCISLQGEGQLSAFRIMISLPEQLFIRGSSEGRQGSEDGPASPASLRAIS